MINLPSDRRHPIASGMDFPNTPRELAFKFLCIANDYIGLKDHNPNDSDIAEVVGAMTMATNEVLGRAK